MCVCAHKHTHTVTKCCSGKFCQTRMVNTRNVTNLDKQENLHQTSVLMSGSTVSPTSPEIQRSELSPSLLWGTSSHLQHSQFPASMDFLLKGRNTVHTQTKERDTASWKDYPFLQTQKGSNERLFILTGHTVCKFILNLNASSHSVSLFFINLFFFCAPEVTNCFVWQVLPFLSTSVLTCVLSVYPHDHREEETAFHICYWATLCANPVHHWRSRFCHCGCSKVVTETQQEEESPTEIEK